MALASAGNEDGIRQYEYKPLARGKYIRYLALDPGRDGEPLSGRLVAVHIDEVPEYDAISYLWGPPDRTGEFKCEGEIIHVTASLQVALQRVRRADRARSVWADQICINQEDIAERNHQVTLMGEIYAKSQTTLIWLGDAAPGASDQAWSLIADLAAIIKPQLAENDKDWNLLPLHEEAVAQDLRWPAVAEMTRCPWFSRVWVVQEAGLSAQPQILYGKHDISWESFYMALNWLRHKGMSIAHSHDVHVHTVHIDKFTLWRTAENHQASCAEDTSLPTDARTNEWSLLDFLHESRILKATDPRDRIYAFLGHHSASDRFTGELILTPDYTVDPAQLCLDFARRWLEWKDDLNILSFVQHSKDHHRNSSLPTWVPVWDTSYIFTVLANESGMYRAGGQAHAPPTIMEDGRYLKVSGVKFDRVRYCSAVFDDEDIHGSIDINDGEQRLDGLAKWTELLSHALSPSINCVYPDEHKLMDCARALVGGAFVGSLSDFKASAAAFLLRYLSPIRSQIDPSYIGELEERGRHGDYKIYKSGLSDFLFHRRFMITEEGHYGLAPPTAMEGDDCCIIFGARTPFVIRPVPNLPEHYELVGEAYIQGAMKGGLVEMCRDGDLEEESIILV